MGRLFYDYYNHQVGVYHIIKKRFKFIALGLLSALFLFLAISNVNAAPSNGKVQINNTGTEYSSIQDAIAAATSGDTINIGQGTFNEDVDVDKNLTFVGAGQNKTIIDSSSDGGYGFADNNAGVDVVIKELTLQNSQHYGIKFSGGSAVIENVTVKNSTRTELDFNGMSSVHLKNIKAHGNNTSGNGVSFTNSDNLTLEGVQTRDNAWGGVALYPYGTDYPVGIDSVFITGLNTNEPNPLYVQIGPGGTSVTGLSAPQFKYTVTNDEFRADGNQFTVYQRNLSQASSYALAIQQAPFTPNADSVISRISDDRKFVPAGLKIANAIEDASSGGVVRVLDGEHEADDTQIVVDKNISLIGDSKENTKLLAQFDTTSGGDGRGWFLIKPGVDLYMDKMTLDGNDKKIFVGTLFSESASGDIRNIAFKNIRTGSSPYNGLAIRIDNSGTVDVRNSSFENIGRIGVLYKGTNVEGKFLNNTYTGKGDGDWLDYTLDISAGADIVVKNNTVTNNTGVAASDGSTSAGFLVTTFWGPGTKAEFRNNTIENNTVGIHVGYAPGPADTSDVIARDNTIQNNHTAGVESTDNLVDARKNFWGHNSGPFDDNNSDGSIPADNPSGLGNKASGPVWYEDWNITPITAPVLVSPGNNSFVNATSPIANDWESIAGATHYTYQSYNVDGGGNCNLSDIRWTEDYTDSQTNSRTIADGLTFCWRVKAVTSYGESDWSELWKVTIDNTPPVVAVTPLGGDGVLHGTVAFEITVTDDNLDPSILDRIWTYLYNNNPPQNPKGANIDLSSGHGTFTVNTKLLDDGAATLDVGRLYDAAGNPSGTGDNYFSGYTIDNTASDGVFVSPTSLDIVHDEFTIEVEINDSSGLGSQQIVMRDSTGAVAGNWSYNVKTGASNTIAGPAGTFDYTGDDFSGNLKITFNTNDLPSDGQYNLRLFTKDTLGNGRSDIYASMLVDNTAPEIEISNIDVSEDKKLSFDLDATDNGPSGLQIIAANIYDETNTTKHISLGKNSSGGSTGTTRLNEPYSGLPGGTPSFSASLSDVDISSLTPDIYTIRAYAKDHATNELRFELVQFTVFPVISDETSTDVTTTSVTIEWTTDHPTTSRVIYDDDSHSTLGSSTVSGFETYGYEFTTPETDTSPKVTSHSVTVTGLTPNTTYYFRTVSHGSPEAVSSEISASTDEESTSSSQSTGGGGGDGSFTAAGFNTTPFNTFGTFGTTTPAPGGGNVLNANDGDNDGNDEENTGEVQADAAGVSSATTAEEASKSSWSWWWILPIIAALLLLFAILRRRGDEEEA